MTNKLHIASNLGLPLTGVPVPLSRDKGTMPADSEAHSYSRAQQLKPCAILTAIEEIRRAIWNNNPSPKNQEIIKKEVEKTRTAFETSISACKKAASKQRVADYNNMPEGALKEKAAQYRKEVLAIRKLQEELIEKINSLPPLSKDLWEETKKLAGLNPTQNTYHYNAEEHVLYLISPDCSQCQAIKEVQRHKSAILNALATPNEEDKNG